MRVGMRLGIKTHHQRTPPPVLRWNISDLLMKEEAEAWSKLFLLVFSAVDPLA